MMADLPVYWNLAQWVRDHGGTTDYEVQGHIHAGLRSAPTTKTYKRWYDRRLTEIQDARDATVARYREALARGEFREPTRRERLERRARGHEDLPATHAARRVLTRMDAPTPTRRKEA